VDRVPESRGGTTMNTLRIKGFALTGALVLCTFAGAQAPVDEPAADVATPVAETAADDITPADAPAPAPSASTQSADAVTAGATRMQLDTTQVTGNRELPKVLVIVPWKNPELVELTGRPLASLVEEALSPIDPDVFRRQVDYYNALQDDDDTDD
ncbi:MAG: hypothetical protein AAFU65_08760, partial [Pseudomonadota bacterium]